jgi:hypothetical protein
MIRFSLLLFALIPFALNVLRRTFSMAMSTAALCAVVLQQGKRKKW